MAAITSALRARTETAPEFSAPRIAVLARLTADGGASKAELLRDLCPLMTPRLAQAEARLFLERSLAALVLAGFASEDRNRFMPSEAGLVLLASQFSLRPGTAPPGWPVMRDIWLTAKALDLGNEPQARLRRLAKPDGLRAVIVQKSYGLAPRPEASPSRLRSQLAVIALERAFGNKIKSGIDRGGLSAKSGRLLAGQLAATPRDFGTDARLIAALAADHAGPRKIDTDSVRMALLRRWIAQGLDQEVQEREPPQLLRPAPPIPANDAAPSRPDLRGFSEAALRAASNCAEGWPGNRKAFISHVWRAIHASHPDWRLTEIEFKCMLAEAHRAGLVVLAGTDLKDKRTVKDVQESAVVYKNTVWHLIRVED